MTKYYSCITKDSDCLDLILQKYTVEIHISYKKREVLRTSLNWLGRKDSNLRDGWTKTSCLTTWRRPIAITIIEYQDYMSRGFIFYTKSAPFKGALFTKTTKQ